MSARQAIQVGTKTVRPVLSLTQADARSRVLSLYKAWYRQIPYIVKDYDIPKSEAQCRAKLKESFLKNKDVKDIRVIDILVIKGQMELKEAVNIWKQKGHIMTYFKPTEEPKPKDFLSKFFSGHE
ncbi:NADH dehydrogenase [ubiquinone] 1 alpha subcomplex subunit 6-like [Maniola hyperantus]|uniref:NADH dehydrogenase [ubiquinone] 1 alpha subcomplex subunit 6-like n=1 Tax=Aphantopus hyperantus TaxID=2795564 RepID=UPI00156995F6|nr:NADH dehydrogenase [ubiquinone] 1 alpha subcomplex subunit 6-like [Maniola hyperantus]